MAQKKAKKSKIMCVALTVFFIYVVASFAVMQVDISKRRTSLDAMQTEINEQQYLNKEIQSILDSGTDSEYIMRIAREKLGFVYPDERVFVDPNRKQ
ncbi:MAG: septum formation initiator family protein [Oscillospiraceae bacterium]